MEHLGDCTSPAARIKRCAVNVIFSHLYQTFLPPQKLPQSTSTLCPLGFGLELCGSQDPMSMFCKTKIDRTSFSKPWKNMRQILYLIQMGFVECLPT